MLKVLAIAIYTFMTMLFYEARVYKTDSHRRRQALAIIQLIILSIMLALGIYLVS